MRLQDIKNKSDCHLLSASDAREACIGWVGPTQAHKDFRRTEQVGLPEGHNWRQLLSNYWIARERLLSKIENIRLEKVKSIRTREQEWELVLKENKKY